MHWIWNIKPNNAILQNKGYYNYQINNVGIKSVQQLPKCTSGSAMPPTILTTSTSAGGRSKNSRGHSTVLQGLLMEQVLLLNRTKSGGANNAPRVPSAQKTFPSQSFQLLSRSLLWSISHATWILTEKQISAGYLNSKFNVLSSLCDLDFELHIPYCRGNYSFLNS